jgi:HPt (histidine-containing phosphotransfer) domain-containing protein
LSPAPRLRDWILIVGVADGEAWVDALEALQIEAHLGTVAGALEQLERQGDAPVVVLGEADPDSDRDELDGLWESLSDHPHPPGLAWVGPQPRPGAALHLRADAAPAASATALQALLVERQPEGFQAQLQALSRDFGARLPARLDELRAALSALRQAPGDVAALTLARALAHKLAGIAGSMGFAAVGDAARGLDDLLTDALRRQTALDWARIDALFDGAQRGQQSRR